MRITFVLPDAGLSGGVRVVAIYAARLKQRGHDVRVVSIPPRPPRLKRRIMRGLGLVEDLPPEPSHLDGTGVPHHVIARNRPIRDRDVPDADVVIATWWETAEWVARLSPSKGAKVYFIQHHEVLLAEPTERVRASYRLPLHKITIARWLVETMAREYADTRVDLIENSVDTGMFSAPPRARKKAPTVGFLYSPHRVKGVADLLKVVEIVRKSVPDLSLVSFGASQPGGALELPAETKFVLRPPQEHLKQLYSSLDAWLCCSHAEGFHLPPLEAMACRTPVVATRVGGTVETVEPGVNGFLADVGDIDALAQHLVTLLRLDDAQWLRFSQAAHARAHRYSWDDAAVLFEQALQRAVGRARADAPAAQLQMG